MDGSVPNLIFACSGAADVGELSDRAARTLAREGLGKMYCLAGVGAEIPSYMDMARNAPDVLVIDGCPIDCGKKCIEKTGRRFTHVRVTDLGLEKGKCALTDKHLELVTVKGREVFQSV